MSRVVVDISTDRILQVEKTPKENVARLFNGRYMIPVPDGTSVDVDDTSTPSTIEAEAAANLLARFPMYDNIVYNFFTSDADVADIDKSALPAVSAVSGFTARSRFQTGRDTGTVGNVPNMTAVLPRNPTTTPDRPGMIITNTFDITAATGGAGADEFMVWWHILNFLTFDDVATDFGTSAGTNAPAEKEIFEINQETLGFSVWISNDDGVTWTQVNRLEPTDLTVFNTDVRLAFVNGTDIKFYLAAFAFLF